MERLAFSTNGHRISGEAEVEVFRLEGQPMIAGAAPSCKVCGIHPQLQISGEVVRAVEPCPYPDGITTEITLEVRSGKIIVTDDLRPVYDWNGRTTADYDSVLGQAEAVRAMAAQGCAYGPVGNSCPGFYRTGPGNYIIAAPWHDDEGIPSLPEDTRLAGVCTDLWAYSIADFDDWIARGGDPETLDWTYTVLEIPPGTYRFVHHTGERDFNGYAAETAIFAHVERIA
ncbi:hypothetical protein OG948_60510 (plasmid) [Embleya sp. NBC_00888]|uniref:hypothetical protein n=1 Tax=Embleya sp. NBC_00888 TaxID=2975960 RepID=UPI002F914B2A|nr:hypothetical protein OG948_60510 [Embleya sp. NBC_00888]